MLPAGPALRRCAGPGTGRCGPPSSATGTGWPSTVPGGSGAWASRRTTSSRSPTSVSSRAVDTDPMGQAHVKRWVPEILPLLEKDETLLGLEGLVTHRMP